MSSFEGIAIGDFHLDKLGQHLDNALKLQLNEICKALDYALHEGIENVVFLGDIADKIVLSDEAKLEFYNLLCKYDTRLKIYIILGNHDVKNIYSNSLNLFSRLCDTDKFKTITIFSKPAQLIIEGVTVNFLPFPANKAIPSENQSLNFAHLDRPGCTRDNGSIMKSGGTEQDDENYWIIGHLHTAQQVGNSYFSGTMYQTNFGENEHKYFIRFRVKQKKKLRCKIELIETFPDFKMINLVVDSKKALSSISKNPLHLYKLFIKEGVKIPKNLNSLYPNIVNQVSFDKQSDLDTFLALDQQIDIDITYGLNEYLTDKGATDWQLKRADEIINEINSGDVL